MKGCKRIKALLLAVLLVLWAAAVPALALDDDEYDGYAADTLTVKVGYFGGPYYEKKVFTLDELWAMDVVEQDYTFIDNMPSVVIDHVAGVRLADVMAAAGIDLNSVQTFYFWTRDKQADYYTSYAKTALIDTPRYCYYSLPDNWDEEEEMGNEYAALDAVPVETLLALADDWNRVVAGGTFGSDYLNLNTNTRFRLIFGQTNTFERTANRSAKWIHEIVVELGGAPTLDLDSASLEGEVGSVLRTEATVSGDSTVAENAQVTWSSSDPTVATVDENGAITIKGEGTAVITASFAGVTATLTVTGVKGEGEAPAGTDAGAETPPQETQPPSDASAPAPTDTPAPAEVRPAPAKNKGETGGVQN